MKLVTARRLDSVDELAVIWLEEARAEAKQYNPLFGYCERIYFERTSRVRRCGPNKGKLRKRSTMEVELLKFLPSGRCVTVKDVDTPGMDSLAEECLANIYIPPETSTLQHFLDLFRQL